MLLLVIRCPKCHNADNPKHGRLDRFRTWLADSLFDHIAPKNPTMECSKCGNKYRPHDEGTIDYG